MAFWETITVEQMGRMLEERDKPWLKAGWAKLTDQIRADPDNLGNCMSNQERRLSNCSRIPAAHFFTWIALIHSRPIQGAARINFRQLASRYLPVFDGRDIQTLFNRLYDNGFANTEHALTRLLQDLAPLSGETTLGDLWTSLKTHNEDAHGARTEWLISGGLDTLRQYLDAWDPTSRWMWGIVQDQTIQEIHALASGAAVEFPSRTVKEIGTMVSGGVKQLVLTGAPGTGKTYAAGLAARFLGAGLPQCGGTRLPFQLVQFHPSYDYTDFVEGLRPVEADGGNQFVRLDGSFKAFCRQVAEENQPDKLYFFLIDEINRADLSKVFGELMFCLESDKRGPEHRVQTQYRNLPAYRTDPVSGTVQRCVEDVFEAGFYIPENVVLLATMNDIDRSVESMDFALRRRFTWMEVEADQEQLEEAFSSGNFSSVLAEYAQEAAQQVMALNRVICKDRNGTGPFELNRQYYIAQGQFSGLPQEFSQTEEDWDELDALLRFVWQFRLRSLLQEYVRGENPEEARKFLDSCESAFRRRV